MSEESSVIKPDNRSNAGFYKYTDPETGLVSYWSIGIDD
jgi:hypothetical protein